MSESFNPILVDHPVPDAGFPGSKQRRNFAEQILLGPQPRVALVLQTRSGSGDGPLVRSELDVTPDRWWDEVRAAARYYKVDLAPSVLVRQLDVPSATEGTEFKVTVFVVVAVDDPVKIVDTELRDAGPINTAIDRAAAHVCSGYVVEAEQEAAKKLEQWLAENRPAPGVRVRHCRVLVVPDTSATKRASMDREFANQREEMRDAHAKAMRELQRQFDEAKEHQDATIEQQHKKFDQAVASHAEVVAKMEARHEQELQEAKQRRALAEAQTINEDIAAHPDNVVGYLLALGDSKPVLDALKVVEDRRRAWWERVKEVAKMEEFKNDEEFRMSVMQTLFDEEKHTPTEGGQANP